MINVFGSKVGSEEIAEVSESINKQWMGMGRSGVLSCAGSNGLADINN